MSERPSIRSSSLPQLFQCPASRKLIPLSPKDDESTGAAIRGDWCHWRAARTLVDDYGATDPEEGLPPEPAFRATSYDHWLAEYFVDQILFYANGEDAILVEQPIVAHFDDFTLTGHPDVMVMRIEDGDVVEIRGFDLKTGPVPVTPAAYNEQLLGYFQLAQAAWPTIRKQTWSICQPTNDDEYDERNSSVTLEGDELQRTVANARGRILAALSDPTLNSDGPACKYCPALAICPAIRKDIELMKMKLTNEELERLQQTEGVTLDLVEIERDRTRITDALTSISTLLKSRVSEQGGTVQLPGYDIKVFDRRGRRNITDNKAFWNRLDELEVDEDTKFELLSYSLTPLEDYLAKKRKIPKRSKKEDKETAATLVRDAIAGIHTQQVSKILSIKETDVESEVRNERSE